MNIIEPKRGMSANALAAHREEVRAGFPMCCAASVWFRRFRCPKLSIDLAMPARDFGGPYNPLVSSSRNLDVSQSARHLNTVDTTCPLDLMRETSFPSCSRKARTWLTFGMKALSSYFFASVIRTLFFLSSDNAKEPTIETAFGLGLGFLTRLTEELFEAGARLSLGSKSSSASRTISYPQSSTRVDNKFRNSFFCTLNPPWAIILSSPETHSRFFEILPKHFLYVMRTLL